jgi:hypothetical protein
MTKILVFLQPVKPGASAMRHSRNPRRRRKEHCHV